MMIDSRDILDNYTNRIIYYFIMMIDSREYKTNF